MGRPTQPCTRMPPACASTVRWAAANSSGSSFSARSRPLACGSCSSVRPAWVRLKATAGWAAAIRSSWVTQWPSSVASERRNLRRAGVLKNRSATSTRVPVAPAAAWIARSPPSASMVQALSACAVREVMLTAATEAIEASASPRKPSEPTASRSASEAILLVACRASASGSSARGMPPPSSVTTMRLMPPPSSRTSIRVAPASSAFSTSSLTTEAGRSTTSPAAIWLTSRSGSAAMRRGGGAGGSDRSAAAEGGAFIGAIIGSGHRLPGLAPGVFPAWCGRRARWRALAAHV